MGNQKNQIQPQRLPSIPWMALWLCSFLLPLTVLADIATEEAEIQRIVNTFRQSNGLVGMSVAVSRLSSVPVYVDSGLADQDAGRAVDHEVTRFRWASLSKGMTGIIAQLLASRGVVDLDTDIRQYIPEYPLPRYWISRMSDDDDADDDEEGAERFMRHEMPRGAVVTLRMLLSNTAGIQSYNDGMTNPVPPWNLINDLTSNTGLEWAVRYWWSAPLLSIPSSKYNYSTFSFNLGAVALERASGKRFPALVRDFISSPLGLRSLGPDYAWSPQPVDTVGYRRAAAGQPLEVEDDGDVSWKAAGGGMISTPKDMHLYCRSVAGTGLLQPTDKAVVFQRRRLSDGSPIDYGLGWAVEENLDHWGRRFSHDGNQAKTRTRIELYPDINDPICVTMMTNTRIPQMKFNDLTRELAEVLHPRGNHAARSTPASNRLGLESVGRMGRQWTYDEP